MAITSRKITTYAKNIVGLSDQPNKDGLTGAQLKAMFDGRTDEEVKASINGIVDDLVATTDGASGADQIGATPLTGGTGDTVQEVLEEIDGSTVHNTGNETIAGVKTFSSSPIVPTPTTDMQASTKKYVDDLDAEHIDYDNTTSGLTATETQSAIDELASEKVDTADIVNDLTTGGATVPLSAEQGKTLNTNKIETSAVVNGLTETNAGKVLDARQGKTLSDKIGNQTYTEDNYITDSEPLTESVDKLDMAVKDNADLISTNTLKINEKTSYGVYTGLVVAQQTVADMTVKCSAGTIYMANGDRFAIDAVASIAVTAADATNPRIDIVYVSSAGAVTYLAGTAAATPSAPSVPAGGQKIAEISVSNGATTVVAANIADRRKSMWTEPIIIPTLQNNWINFNATSYSTAGYYKNVLNIVCLSGALKGGLNNTTCFTLPVGYRPSKSIHFPVLAVGTTEPYVLITSDGSVIIRFTGTATLISLDGITFRV